VARLLEGELLEYRGAVWIVKGFQHPPGYVVAYPRYDALSLRRLEGWRAEELLREALCRWRCIELDLPAVPLHRARFIEPRIDDPVLEEFRRLIADYASLDLDQVLPTGSLALGVESEDPDIDLVIYSWRAERVYGALEELARLGIVRSMGLSELESEWRRKHRGLGFEVYRRLREGSLLQGVFRGRRYSVRIVPWERGVEGCVDPVRRGGARRLVIEVVDPVSPYTTPAVYEVEVVGEGLRATMMSFRLLFTELARGTRIGGVMEVETPLLEARPRIVPDRGVVEWVERPSSL